MHEFRVYNTIRKGLHSEGIKIVIYFMTNLRCASACRHTIFERDLVSWVHI